MHYYQVLLKILQLIQNAAVRAPTGPFSLHWLPVKPRIDFKILVFACKVLTDQAPS